MWRGLVAELTVGYARCSTVSQDLEVQRGKLLALGVDQERIYFDHGFSGKQMSRDGLEKALAACRAGDTFVVPSLDRLARDALGTLEVMRELGERGIALSNNGTIYDPNDPMAKLFFTMLAAVAEAEGGWVSLRTKEAMARPAVRAKMKGKQPSLTPRQDVAVLQLYSAETSVPDLATLFKTSRASIYRALDRARARAAAPQQPASREG